MGNPSTFFFLSFLATVMAVLVAIVVSLLWLARKIDAFSARPIIVLMTAWVVTTGVLAANGLLVFDSMPPTMFPVVVGGLVLTAVFAKSHAGSVMAGSLPLWFLVGFQSFRIVVELLLHRAFVEGLAPPQMTFDGLNFDIVSGISGGALGLWLLRTNRAPRWLLMSWNVLGLVLLGIIVTIAILSTPVPFRVFMQEPANSWITAWPWIWLPTVFVPAALLFHLLLFKRIGAVGPPEPKAG